MISQDRTRNYYRQQHLSALLRCVASISLLMIATNVDSLIARSINSREFQLDNSNLKDTSLPPNPSLGENELQDINDRSSRVSDEFEPPETAYSGRKLEPESAYLIGEDIADSLSQSRPGLIHSSTMIAPNINTNDINNIFPTTGSPSTSESISVTTMSSNEINSSTGYATVNYNGIIGINATDPFAITTESRIFSLPLGVQLFMCLLYGTLAFTAVTSNVIVCYIVLSNSKMRTATNYFIVNLAVGDILMALLCIPFTFLSNLILQYWPFGLSLCVIVSYSQANSVFISAYTMVAISIDKYIAIMYPMRLRMPKTQAKVIILVIWSAALLTSLPIAILSSLTPASPDMGPPATTTTPPIDMPSSSTMSPFTTTSQVARTSPYSNLSTITTIDPDTDLNDNQDTSSTHSATIQSNEVGSPTQYSSNSSASNYLKSPETITSNEQQQLKQKQDERRQQQQQALWEEQNKYFCQESWESPKGRYYYSMGLMILQFVLPLFVLVITYTRIVIAVWGKKMPGEEDNARDARMARSKRKMIKMVIFCVIAFALTWLPFNALIVVGDLRPEIWENPNIMYIWFITHYLAMCHTVTNPLIYIWMNNRFRAGFKQVVSDFYKLLQTSLAFVLCYCLCLGCCFNCSRRKYARVAMDLNRRKQNRRGPLTSSGSVNLYTNNLGNNTKNSNNTMMTSNNNNNNNNNNNLTTNLTNHSQVESTNANQPTQLSCNPTSSNCVENDDNARKKSSDGHRAADQVDNEAIIDARTQNGPQNGDNYGAAGPQYLIGLVCMFKRRRDKNCERCEVAHARNQDGQQLAHRQQDTTRIDNKDNNNNNSNNEPRTGTGDYSSLAAQTKQVDSQLVARKKKRKRQSHAISLQMTTRAFYPGGATDQVQPPAHKLGCRGAGRLEMNNHVGKQSASTRWRMRRKSSATGSSSTATSKFRKSNGLEATAAPSAAQSDCPACRQSLTPVERPKKAQAGQSQRSGSTSGASGQQTSGPHNKTMNSGRFLVDMRQSSQSTASISAQTYNTSLAISPLNSTGGVNNSNTSASSFSANGGPVGAPERHTNTATTITARLSVSASDKSDDNDNHNDDKIRVAPQVVGGSPGNHQTTTRTRVGRKTADMKRDEDENKPPGQIDEEATRTKLKSSPVSGPKVDVQKEPRSPISSQSSGSMPAEEANVIMFDDKKLAGFCAKHSRQMGAGGRSEGELSQTEEDVCDVFQVEGPHQRIARGAKSSGSLELISDHLIMCANHYDDQLDDQEDDQDDNNHEESDDNDADDEELEGETEAESADELESEYGDEQSPLRRGEATEMVAIVRRPICETSLSSSAEVRQVNLLNRLFKSTGDELCGLHGTPVRIRKQTSGDTVKAPVLGASISLLHSGTNHCRGLTTKKALGVSDNNRQVMVEPLVSMPAGALEGSQHVAGVDDNVVDDNDDDDQSHRLLESFKVARKGLSGSTNDVIRLSSSSSSLASSSNNNNGDARQQQMIARVDDYAARKRHQEKQSRTRIEIA